MAKQLCRRLALPRGEADTGGTECSPQQLLPDALAHRARLIRLTLAFPASIFEPTVGQWLRDFGAIAGEGAEAALLVGLEALKRRRSMLLPPGGSAEAIAEHAHRWSVGVLIVAVLAHGRAPGEARWALYGQSVPSALRDWLSQAPGLIGEIQAWLASGEARGGGAIAALLGPPVQTGMVSASVPAAELPGHSLDETVGGFLRWLDAGLCGGVIRSSGAGALVHGLDDGLLLVSPRVFEACMRDPANGGKAALVPAGMALRAQVQRLQGALLGVGLHRPGVGGAGLIAFERMGANGPVLVTGIVIDHPDRFLRNLPPVDPTIRERRSAVHSPGQGNEPSP
jgi:hypothetical protein